MNRLTIERFMRYDASADVSAYEPVNSAIPDGPFFAFLFLLNFIRWKKRGISAIPFRHLHETCHFRSVFALFLRLIKFRYGVNETAKKVVWLVDIQ